MLATLARTLPDGEHCYEPKWDGFRCLVVRAGSETLLSSRNRRPFDRYFPELVAGLLAVGGARFVLDGEIVATGPHGLDFAALMLRLHPSPSPVTPLRAETPACFVAFLVAAGDEDLRSAPLVERWARLVELLAGASPSIVTTPATDDRAAAEWMERFTGGGIDGVVGKAAAAYEAGRRSPSRLKVKPERTADCVVGGVRLVEGQPLVASLLLASTTTPARWATLAETARIRGTSREVTIRG